jgi:RND family efflux transporter MFP subunit
LSRLVALWIGIALVATGCGGDAAAIKSTPPATVINPPKEQELSIVTLTPQAVDRLGVRTAAVEYKPVRRRRTVGGELMIAHGKAIVVAAPVNGTLAAPAGGNWPTPGDTVRKGEEIVSWVPLLSPERAVLTPSERVRLAEARASLATSQIEAARQVESAKVTFEAAQVTLARAEQLLKVGAGTIRAVEDARAQLSLARESFTGAQSRHELLSKTSLDAEGGQQSPQSIKAPVSGVLRKFDVSPGQTVTAGTVLFEVVEHDPLWVRVPIFVGQWREVDVQADAEAREFGQPISNRGYVARPVTAPPSADPLAATVDLFFEIDNEHGQLRPGQKVSVSLVQKGEEASLIVPWSAVLYDIHGGAWVYEQMAAQTYVRRRIDVHYVADGQAVLASGPAEGTTVVIEAAAELFGTEFGIGK